MPATGHWESGVQDPWVSLDCVCQELVIRQVCHMGKHLQVDTLDAVDDQAKASGPYLGGCSYCNSRPAGLDQGDL